MKRRHSSGAITVSGLIYICIIIGTLAVVAMKLFPLYSEKLKVDLALEKVAGQAESALKSKTALAKLIIRQFEVSEVRRWREAEFIKLLQVKKMKDGKGKIMSLDYEIRGPLFGELDVVLMYTKSLKLGEPVSD
ncbi:MAG: hypothetical protein ACI915_001728 [Gammaproteobacteria bacterium]|jgi:hypothetical protein